MIASTEVNSHNVNSGWLLWLTNNKNKIIGFVFFVIQFFLSTRTTHRKAETVHIHK